MTAEEAKQMMRIFPNGWTENEVPAYIRQREEKEQAMAQAEIEEIMEENTSLEEKERRLEDLEAEEFARKEKWERDRDYQDSVL